MEGRNHQNERRCHIVESEREKSRTASRQNKRSRPSPPTHSAVLPSPQTITAMSEDRHHGHGGKHGIVLPHTSPNMNLGASHSQGASPFFSSVVPLFSHKTRTQTDDDRSVSAHSYDITFTNTKLQQKRRGLREETSEGGGSNILQRQPLIMENEAQRNHRIMTRSSKNMYSSNKYTRLSNANGDGEQLLSPRNNNNTPYSRPVTHLYCVLASIASAFLFTSISSILSFIICLGYEENWNSNHKGEVKYPTGYQTFRIVLLPSLVFLVNAICLFVIRTSVNRLFDYGKASFISLSFLLPFHGVYRYIYRLLLPLRSITLPL